MARVFFCDKIGFDQNTHVDGIKLLVDDSAVADKTAEPQISFYQGR